MLSIELNTPIFIFLLINYYKLKVLINKPLIRFITRIAVRTQHKSFRVLINSSRAHKAHFKFTFLTSLTAIFTNTRRASDTNKLRKLVDIIELIQYDKGNMITIQLNWSSMI